MILITEFHCASCDGFLFFQNFYDKTSPSQIHTSISIAHDHFAAKTYLYAFSYLYIPLYYLILMCDREFSSLLISRI